MTTPDPSSDASTSAHPVDAGGGPAPVVSLVSRHRRVVAAHRASSLLMALSGLAGVLLLPLHIAYAGVSAVDVSLFLVMYVLTMGGGLSVGYHRHFTHGAFRAPRPVRAVLAVLGAMGGQGPLTYWVAIHRRHHEHSDEEGDPHSPHLSGSVLGGLWHAHYAWSLGYGSPNAMHYCPDLVREPYLMWINRYYRLWVLLGLALPTIAGGLLGGGVSGAFGGLLWGGLVRMFLSSNMTWALNSICHRFGARPNATRDHSTNNAWLALPTLGESWHNNHHAFPTSAAHGLRWWQVDINYAIIRALALVGLATSVKRAPVKERG